VGRRRIRGKTAGSQGARACPHPQRALQYQLGPTVGPDRVRCTRCGQQLLAADFVAPVVPYTTRGRR
jgi:hypothetical protein